MFYAAEAFPFVRALETHWRLIRAEFSALTPAQLMPWPEKMLYDQGWQVFGLFAFGRRLDKNCAQCPRTAELVAAVPEMTTAGFSVLAPGTHIRPHVGYSNTVLRCHLGIDVPPDCALRVAGETRAWEEGRCLIFDDTVEHEAWNRSPSTRTVLLIDFKRPLYSAPITVPDSLTSAVETLTNDNG